MTGIMGTIRHLAARRGLAQGAAAPGHIAWGRPARLLGTAALLLGTATGLTGCGALDVTDPTVIEDQELNNPRGAELLRAAALRALSGATDDGAYNSGLLADEFRFTLSPWDTPQSSPEGLLDRRESEQYEAIGYADGGYGPWQQLRTKASEALPKLRAYAPAPEAKAGEMLALRGYATMRLAEDFCPGFPLHEVIDYRVTYDTPRSNEEAFERALADFDSAVTLAADSARILHLAQVGRARTLLGLGRFAEADAAVDGVPTEYVANAEYRFAFFDPGDQTLTLWNSLAFPGGLGRSVADQEGGTGLDFIAADDPRVPIVTLDPAPDGTPLYGLARYPDPGAPIAFSSGIEARLIEAEAALQGGGDWLGILNALRTTCTDAAVCPTPAPAGSGGVESLPPLTDPGTEAARVDLLFRERAFWLFGTGHRLADLRRLVQRYGRPAESVFPTGTNHQGAAYGTAMSIPFPAAREAPYSPEVTGCTSR